MEAALMMLVVFGFVAFVLWLVASHTRAKVRHRTEVQKELIAKFATPQELADFLNSEAGKLLIRGANDTTPPWLGPAPRPPNEQIGIAIGWGVLVLFVGVAVIIVRGVELSGAVITAVGVGLLFNALLRAWFFRKRAA